MIPTDQRDCIVLKYYYGFTSREIAEMLKVKEPTVKARIRYGLNKLSILLKGKRQMEKSSNEDKHIEQLFKSVNIPQIPEQQIESVVQIAADYLPVERNGLIYGISLFCSLPQHPLSSGLRALRLWQ